MRFLQLWKRVERKTTSSEDEDMAAASEGEQRPRRWLDRWAASRASCDGRPNRARSSMMDHRDPIKTLEIDTGRPFSYTTPANLRRVPPASLRRRGIKAAPPQRSGFHSRRGTAKACEARASRAQAECRCWNRGQMLHRRTQIVWPERCLRRRLRRW